MFTNTQNINTLLHRKGYAKMGGVNVNSFLDYFSIYFQALTQKQPKIKTSPRRGWFF